MPRVTSPKQSGQMQFTTASTFSVSPRLAARQDPSALLTRLHQEHKQTVTGGRAGDPVPISTTTP
jgi:hypothetical protein